MSIPLRTRVAAAAAAGMVGVTLSSCGGAPAAASAQSFCDVTVGLFSGPDTEAESPKAEADYIRALVQEMEEVGTPADIPTDARDGFELTVELLGDVDAADVEGNGLDKLEDDLSEEEKGQLDAFGKYAFETCEFDIPGLTPPKPPELSESPE